MQPGCTDRPLNNLERSHRIPGKRDRQTSSLKLLLRIQPMCWTKGDLRLRDKLKLYWQVFLPMLNYGHEIWYRETKKTLLESIEKSQRRVVTHNLWEPSPEHTGARARWNCWRSSVSCRWEPSCKERRAASKVASWTRDSLREERLQLSSDDFDAGQLKKKEPIWCMTEAGPSEYSCKRLEKRSSDVYFSAGYKTSIYNKKSCSRV